jgi:hypothetical protein
VTEQPEEIPVHEGPDAKDWPEAAPRLWGLVLNIEFLTRIIEALDGPVLKEDRRVHGEALEFMVQARHEQRAVLAEMILHAYRVVLPEEPGELATEVTGGFRGDGNGPGDRDHL